jgi:tetratricopeptide (TPR) repeat protein
LNLDYDFEPSANLFEPMVLASSILIFGLIALAWYLRRRAAVVSFSIFWFFLTLAPTSSVVPILDVIFEHRLYLPMVGLCLSFPLLFQWLARLVKSRTSLTLKPVPICAGLLVILTVGTILRNEVWRDEITLWSDVVAKSPDKARGYNALAMSHFRRVEFESALKVARAGFERLPQHEAQFVDTIGNVYLQLGRYDEAVTAFRSAIESEEGRAVPDHRFLSLEYNNVGVTQLYMWRLLRENEQQVTPGEFARRKVKILEPALEAFRKSLELEEETFTALDSLVNVTHWLGRQEEMRREHLAILEGGDEFRASYVLAKLAFNDNDFEAALEHFDRAVQHRSSEHLLWFNYAYAFERLGRLDEAILKYLEATRVNPVFIEAHHNVALLYMKKSEFEVAVEHFEEVLRLYPDHESTNLHLAKIYIYNGQHSLARKHLTIVLHGSPEHPEALSLWQQL